MRSKYWALLIGVLFLISAVTGFFLLRPQPETSCARITSDGKVIATVDLHQDQQFTVTLEDGRENTITVRNGKIAVTAASCPDHYCMKRGFCASGADIVCLPNQLIIHFLQDMGIDAAAG